MSATGDDFEPQPDAEAVREHTRPEATADYWIARWAPLDTAELGQAWHTDMRVALGAGLRETGQEQLLRILRGTLRMPLAALRAELRVLVREAGQQGNTHLSYATQWIDFHAEHSNGLIAADGAVWQCRYLKVWVRIPVQSALPVSVGAMFAGPRCERRSDYNAIAACVYDVLEGRPTKHRFEDAPRGFAVGKSDAVFVRLTPRGPVAEPLAAEHMCRFAIPVALDAAQDAPLWQAFLDNAFPTTDADHAEQRALLAQMMLVVLTGLGTKQQIAFLWRGATGSGKTTMQKILAGLMPEDVLTKVDPAFFGREYYRAELAGKRLNLVGELPRKEPLTEAFLNVLGDEALYDGRFPSGRVFKYRLDCTHIFNCNEFPPTTVRTKAFWRRWRILDWRHTKPESGRDHFLAERILATEKAAVLRWALGYTATLFDDQGQLRLIETVAHRAALAAWRQESDSVRQFVEDDEWVQFAPEDQRNELSYRCGRQAFYDAYVQFCRRNNFHPVSSRRFPSDAEEALAAHGVRLAKDADGNRAWRGVRVLF